jgi:hypothetical protein
MGGKMLSKIYKWILAVIASIAGVLGLLLSLQTQRNKKLTAEANGAKKEAKKAAEQLDAVNQSVQKAEDKRQDVLSTEATLDNIKKETAEAVKTAQEIRKTDSVIFGKWAIIFAVLFLSSGCASTLEKCRAAYPCPGNICVTVTPPKLETLPRPELTELAVRYDEQKEGFVLTPEQIGALVANERALIATVNGYEKIIDAYNAWRLKK